MPLNSKDLLDRRRQLGVLARKLQGQLNDSETQSFQELSSYDNHPADLASDTFQRELTLGIKADLRRRLNQVERARTKVEEGTYGVCDRCGQPIAEARLEALPESIYCPSCQTIIARETGFDVRASNADTIPSVQESLVLKDLARYGSSDSPQDEPYEPTYAPPVIPVEDVEDPRA